MKTYITFTILAVTLCLVSCKKKQPENVPVPKAGPPVRTAAAVSSPDNRIGEELFCPDERDPTAPVFRQNPLTAPGNYLKTTVGYVKEAKDARAIYEKTAKDGLKSLDLNNTGGN